MEAPPPTTSNDSSAPPPSSATNDASSTTPTDPAAPRTTFPIGTRKSALALAQAHLVTATLSSSHPRLSFPLQPLATAGDLQTTQSLQSLSGDKALWTTELEAALRAGATSLVVHSLKDMPTQLPAGCALGAACGRAERRDCVVVSPAGATQGWTTLGDLPPGSVVGTSSVRRAAQLRRRWPELVVRDVRGNVGTRLRKLDAEGGEYAALVLAATGLQRLGLGARVGSYLSVGQGGWYGPVGQGALGVEIRSGDRDAKELCASLMRDAEGAPPGEGRRCWLECLAERSMLRALEGGCSVPAGVETAWEGDDALVVRALVVSVDGRQAVEAAHRQTVGSEEDAELCGLAVAGDLIRNGAEAILKEITLNRKIIADSGGA